MSLAGAGQPAGQPTAPLLHTFLGIGLVLVATALAIARHSGAVSLDGLDGSTPTIAFVLSGVSVVLAALALVVFKPRVPERRPGQSVEQYWSTPEVAARALPIWFLLEGAGVLPAIGYFLTGAPASAITAMVMIAAFWFVGPNAFAKP